MWGLFLVSRRLKYCYVILAGMLDVLDDCCALECFQCRICTANSEGREAYNGSGTVNKVPCRPRIISDSLFVWTFRILDYHKKTVLSYELMRLNVLQDST